VSVCVWMRECACVCVCVCVDSGGEWTIATCSYVRYVLHTLAGQWMVFVWMPSVSSWFGETSVEDRNTSCT